MNDLVHPIHHPSHLIRHGKLTPDASRVFAIDATDAADRTLPPDEPEWIVSLSTWSSSREALSHRQHPVAVLIEPDDDPWQLVAEGQRDLSKDRFAFIAVAFPAFTDGRGYSHAQTLRHHLGYTGELRAVGDVLVDTMFYMASCGFDAFAVKAEHDPQAALRALDTFSVRYQRGYRSERDHAKA